MKLTVPCFALALVAVPAGQAAERIIPLPNPGFEERTTLWNNTNDNGMSAAVPEAAQSGKLGLRVTDESDTLGSSLAAQRFPATPGKTYEVRFQGRIIKGEGVAVYLRFYDAKGGYLNTPELKNQINVSVRRGDTQWKQLAKKGVAPAGAIQVEVWVHSFSKNVVTADFDDFVLVECDA